MAGSDVEGKNLLTALEKCTLTISEDTATGENAATSIVSAAKSTDVSPFYKKAQNYWADIPPTINGMLGGLGYINAIDIQGSINFLRELKQPNTRHALDCGAGIGRVTKNLLLPRYLNVDMVEQDKHFCEKARDYCKRDRESSLDNGNRLQTIYNMGLQEFTPETGKYDLVWSQWVLGHLTDEDLLKFFERIRLGLADKGLFVIKENINKSQEAELDETDSSVTRPLKTYEKLLAKAGMRIIKTARQQNFPKELYPVYMIASKRI